MPLFEYQCKNGHTHTKLCKSLEEAPSSEECPECDLTATRQVSSCGITLKGSGFYANDYKRAGCPACEKDGERRET